MRALQTKELLYIFNPWSNGERVMATATSGTPTYRRMAELARTDKRIEARHDLYQHRVVEELYDVENDPDCLVNLIDSAAHQKELARLQTALESWMVRTGDHMLDVFRHRDDPAVREAYVAEKENVAESRNQKKRGGRKPAPAGRKQADLISLETPKSAVAGSPVTVRVHHDVEAELGKQLVHVTIKAGKQAARVDRKIVEVSGSGVAEVRFDLPANVPDDIVEFAAFIGKDYPTSLQHLQTDPVPVQ
jgi:N-sulfoglucosamine sulfohydrolase